MFPKRSGKSDIRIYHYNIRGRQQFLEKMINGGKQLEQNPSKHGGRHWRYFYGLYKEGKLNEEYDRVIGSGSSTDCRQTDIYMKIIQWQIFSRTRINRRKR